MEPEKNQSPERIVWTPQLVTKFWDGLARAGFDDLLAFGRMARRCIYWVTAHHLVPNGRHLDYGGGSGEVAAYLIAQGFPFALYEPSSERGGKADKLLAELPGFLGHPDESEKESFDVVTCFEVLEHILDQDFDSVCDDLANFVKPGGKLIVSTPNSENLDLSMVYCPVSNKLFHRWQHVRSISAPDLDRIFSERGFTKIVTHQLDFEESLFEPYLDILGISIQEKKGDQLVPLHIHQIKTDTDGIIGGAKGLLYVGVKSQR